LWDRCPCLRWLLGRNSKWTLIQSYNIFTSSYFLIFGT
jgi:uncharacterized membrane protein